jgi:hypothetical protein
MTAINEFVLGLWEFALGPLSPLTERHPGGCIYHLLRAQGDRLYARPCRAEPRRPAGSWPAICRCHQAPDQGSGHTAEIEPLSVRHCTVALPDAGTRSVGSDSAVGHICDLQHQRRPLVCPGADVGECLRRHTRGMLHKSWPTRSPWVLRWSVY